MTDSRLEDRHTGSRLEPTPETRTAFLCGQYDALGWVLTSPRITGELRDRIHAKAMDIYDQAKAQGVAFEEGSDA